MSELESLYQEVILDHNRRPRNFKVLENANRKAEGFNPLCGDRVTIYLEVEDNVVKDVTFQGSGCAISMASSSIMTESLKGKSLVEVERLWTTFRNLVRGEVDESAEQTDVGKLAVFGGVSKYPVRVKCATLTWHTLRAALKEEREAASTE
jgi:nitrogen fixation NifU-like protein